MTSSDYLRVERNQDLAVWRLDEPGEDHNKLSTSALEAIDRALDDAVRSPDIRAIVVISAKPDSFIVGADVRQLQAFRTAEEAEALSRRAHALLKKVKGQSRPIVAAIHGPAVGGGLEFALACSARIATEHPSTRFALPEVQLGILPGGGGTQLLPRLIGIQQALSLLLTGKNIYPKKARRIGLIDVITHEPGLLHAACELARSLAKDAHVRSSGVPVSATERLLESNPLSRRFIYSKAEERVRKETRGNYPAPLRILECVRTGIEDGIDAGYAAEERYFGALATTPQSRELVRLFFLRSASRKNPVSTPGKKIERMGVLGAGLMGRGIAAVSAENGIRVLVKDRTMELAHQARAHVFKTTTAYVRKGALSGFERDVILERVSATHAYFGFERLELIIEAAPEDAELKQQLIRDIEKVAPPECIFASNTSSIPIATLAEASSRPEQVIGMHYFSPVEKMPLLEIIRKPDTPDWVLSAATDVGLRQGKMIIVVADGPGFYTTRILSLYMNEALELLDQGASIDQTDELMRDFGFPMGPFELFDLVGIDVAAKITQVLEPFFSERGIRPNRKADALLGDGLLGRKSKLGFYRYDGEKKSGVNQEAYRYFQHNEDPGPSPEDIQQRLSLAMCNEAVRCLEGGILQSPRDGDVGAVFGLGFPPFRGGPFRHIDELGAANVAERLDGLRARYGERFAPAEMITSLALTGKKFTAD